MLIQSQAIVLNSTRYSESSLIVHCYTKTHGFCSYLLKGVLKPKKGGLRASLFQPLTLLDIIASLREKETLEYIKEAKVVYHYQHLYTDMTKNAQAYFLADICLSILRQEPKNEALFDFLFEAFTVLDQAEYTAYFHHKFLIELSRFLGFHPGMPTKEDSCFHLQDALFGKETAHHKNEITGLGYTHFVRLLEAPNLDCKIDSKKEDRSCYPFYQ